MSSSQVGIYGAGGFAREVAWLVEHCAAGGEPMQAVAFIDDAEQSGSRMLNGLAVMSLAEFCQRFPGSGFVPAIGAPAARERAAAKALAAGLRPVTVIHPRAEYSRWVEVGEGTVICAACVLTTNIRLGRCVQINLDCTIGHDAVLGDFATLAPGVHVSGCVGLGRRVYVGTGATIINGTPETPLTIGDDAVIGAGACVVRPVPAGTTVVGVPAKPRGG